MIDPPTSSLPNDNLMEEYIQSHCMHQNLFHETFNEDWLDKRLAQTIETLTSNAPQSAQSLIEKKLITEIFPNIFSLPVFTPLICDMIIEETEHFLTYAAEHDLVVHRPNSMNKYGLVLNQMGMMDLLTDLQQRVLLPLSRTLFPQEASQFTSHHSFLVSYSPDTDRALDMHTDDSDVTWNICLGKDGFQGSGLTFCGVMALPDHRQLQGHYNHRVGHAVVHLGHQRHGADSIISGERHNLVIWSKNEVYRTSALFEQAMRAYSREAAPPHEQCLSYTHDRDYQVFLEYPEGRNPYRALMEEGGDGSGALPWCPPASLGYPGMLSHNKLMLLHFHKECEREEREAEEREDRVNRKKAKS